MLPLPGLPGVEGQELFNLSQPISTFLSPAIDSLVCGTNTWLEFSQLLPVGTWAAAFPPSLELQIAYSSLDQGPKVSEISI